MYTPTAAVILTTGVKTVRESLHIDAKVATFYLTSPLFVYSSLLFYYSVVIPSGFFTLDKLSAAVPWLAPEVYIALGLVFGYIAAVSINALFALGEEIGWREFLQSRLEAAMMGSRHERRLGFLAQFCNFANGTQLSRQ